MGNERGMGRGLLVGFHLTCGFIGLVSTDDVGLLVSGGWLTSCNFIALASKYCLVM